MTKRTSIARQSSDQPDGQAPLMGFHPAPALQASIVRWAEQQPDMPSLPEAVGRLVEIALANQMPGARKREKQTARASEMAGAAIDKLADEGLAPDERASRKRRLVKGP